VTATVIVISLILSRRRVHFRLPEDGGNHTCEGNEGNAEPFPEGEVPKSRYPATANGSDNPKDWFVDKFLSSPYRAPIRITSSSQTYASYIVRFSRQKQFRKQVLLIKAGLTSSPSDFPRLAISRGRMRGCNSRQRLRWMTGTAAVFSWSSARMMMTSDDS
jgi:hypothetical protein